MDFATTMANIGDRFSRMGGRLSNMFQAAPSLRNLTLADVTATFQAADWNWGYDAAKLVVMARIALSSYNNEFVASGATGRARPGFSDRCKETVKSFAVMFCVSALIETAGNLRNWDTQKLLESVATTAALSTLDGAATFRLMNDTPRGGKLRRWPVTTLAALWMVGRIGIQNPIFANAMNQFVA